MVKNKNASFVKQTSRIVKVGTNVGGFVAKVATKNLLGISKKDGNAEELMNLLGNLKGPIMKVAQILATIPDALPKEYSKHLSKLQSEAPSMGWLFVKRRMKDELGDSWQDNFIDFQKKASKAASLGQVHRAILKKNNLMVACKLQYPDMNNAIEADLKQLRLIMKLYNKIDNTIDTNEIYDELKERLFEETDYKNELKNIRIYRNIFLNDKSIHVPQTFNPFSTEKLITMTWLEGVPLSKIYKANNNIRNKIASNLFKAWYLPFYKYGIIHGDPHPGNYTINEKEFSLNLLDYGCIRIFKPDFVAAVIKLYYALKNKDNDLAAQAYKEWGFKNINKNLVDALNVWALYLYDPLLDNKKRLIQKELGAAFGKELLNKVRKELKKHGGVKPPREFVLVDRAAIGLGSVFMNLKAELNWHKEFEKLISNFDVRKIKSNQSKIIRQV